MPNYKKESEEKESKEKESAKNKKLSIPHFSTLKFSFNEGDASYYALNKLKLGELMKLNYNFVDIGNLIELNRRTDSLHPLNNTNTNTNTNSVDYNPPILNR